MGRYMACARCTACMRMHMHAHAYACIRICMHAHAHVQVDSLHVGLSAGLMLRELQTVAWYWSFLAVVSTAVFLLVCFVQIMLAISGEMADPLGGFS